MNSLPIQGDGSCCWLTPPAPLRLRFLRPDGAPLTPEDESLVTPTRPPSFWRWRRRLFGSPEEAQAALAS